AERCASSVSCSADHRAAPRCPTRRSSDLREQRRGQSSTVVATGRVLPVANSGRERSQGVSSTRATARPVGRSIGARRVEWPPLRSEEHTSELQSREKLVCRLLLEKKNASM